MDIFIDFSRFHEKDSCKKQRAHWNIPGCFLGESQGSGLFALEVRKAGQLPLITPYMKQAGADSMALTLGELLTMFLSFGQPLVSQASTGFRVSRQAGAQKLQMDFFSAKIPNERRTAFGVLATTVRQRNTPLLFSYPLVGTSADRLSFS